MLFARPLAALVGMLVAAIAFYVVSVARPPLPPEPRVAAAGIQSPPARQSTDGAQMYRLYCAPCHGVSGQGDGPVASSLKQMPTDLTQLTARNAGTYPAAHVEQVLKSGVEVPAHGSSDMPIWGATFQFVDRDATIVRTRIWNLVEFVRSLQPRAGG